MATLDANPSSATFNAYCTLAEANDYHTTRLHNTAWGAATNASKESAIIWATREFDAVDWKGYRTVPNQNHEFPRNMVFINGGEYDYGSDAIYNTWMFPKDSVPQFLKDATAELAFYLIQMDWSAPTGTEGFKSIQVDTIKLDVDKNDRPSWMSPSIRNLIYRYMRTSNRYLGRTVRTA